MKKISAFIALISITMAAMLASAMPASADASSSDISLSSFQLDSEAVLSSPFRSEQTYYDVYAQNSTFTWSLQTTNPLDRIRIVEPNGNVHESFGVLVQSVSYQAKTNQITTIRISSEDQTNVVTYTFNVSSKVMPAPVLTNLSQTTMPNTGGVFVSGTVNHFFADPNEFCYTSGRYYYKNQWGGRSSSGFDVRNVQFQPDGSALVTFLVQATQFGGYVGKSDLELSNACYAIDYGTGSGQSAIASTLYKDELNVENPTIDSVSLTDEVTFRSVIDIKGFGISSNASIRVSIKDPATGEELGTEQSWRVTDTHTKFRLGVYWWNRESWLASKPVDLLIKRYDPMSPEKVIYTKRLTFVPWTVKSLAVSPAKGPISGGNIITVSGQNMCSPSDEMLASVSIGGQYASFANGNFWVHCDDSSDGYQRDSNSRLDVIVPPGIKPGPVDIVVDNGFGPVTLATKYVYGAAPTLTSISPASVSNTGGSIVTIMGTNFGVSGNPSVIIDGIKSPWVQRISSTKILAMVPKDSGKTGSVSVNLISASGGGALDTPGTMSLQAASTKPTVTSVTPNKASVAGGDTITIIGTGFVSGATGVVIGDYVAPVISSSATQLQVELPTGDAAGAQDIVVGTPTGIVTKARALTYVASPGITSISPAVIASSAEASATKVSLTGVGFGSAGTIKVGGSSAIAYTATNSGTVISNIEIPTGSAGQVLIAVTPEGSKVAFTGSVKVTSPEISYFGPDPKFDAIGGGPFQNGYAKASSDTAGGAAFRIEGSGFGSSGKVRIGTTELTPSSYSDALITFTMPAKAVGTYDVRVVPTRGGISADLPGGLGVYVLDAPLSISKVQSVVDNNRSDARYTFDPSIDSSDLFEITGTKLNGSDPSKTRVVMNNDDVEIVPVSVTASSVIFHAPRGYNPTNWVALKVLTDLGSTVQNQGIFYVGNTVSPEVQQASLNINKGLCSKDPVGDRPPARFQASGAGVFGASGTVTLAGVALDSMAFAWSANSVDVDLTVQNSDLGEIWGAKSVVFTPDDPALLPLTFNFTCSVDALVSTRVANGASDLTINAGESYTPEASFVDPLPNADFTPSADGYIWQTGDDYRNGAGWFNTHYGLPVAAGEYYVFADVAAGSYDRQKYASVTNADAFHLVIVGTPITFTPKLASGNSSSITYKGQLGDGTNGSSNDLTFTNSSVADNVTSVTWQYRNHACALNDPNTGWISGLPKDVAISPSGCGGDDTSVTSWEIQVAGFTMLNGGFDRSVYYLPTQNTFNLTINKKAITATGIKVEKIYDGTNNATLGAVTFDGAIPGDDVTLDPASSQGATYSDATAGSGRAITLAAPLALAWGWSNNYTLTNSNLAVTGRILKANANLKLTSSLGSVVITNPQNINISVATTDLGTGQPPAVGAGVPNAVITSKTPSKCTYSQGLVTPIAAGDCIIEARQAGSTNYNTSVSWHDDSTTIESVTIKIYPAPKTVTVIADDLTWPVNMSYGLSTTATGLLDGDSVDGFTWAYYKGTTLLDNPPVEIGTYRIVPIGGTLHAADSAMYSNVFKYVAGRLVITAAPPTIDSLSVDHGPQSGANDLVISGSGFDTVTSIVIGDVTIRKPDFTVNGSGTEISLKVPAGTSVVDVIVKAGAAYTSTQYRYDAPPVPSNPFSLTMNSRVVSGSKLSGQEVQIAATGLRANSAFSLKLGANSVLFSGTTDANGNFSEVVTLPNAGCNLLGKQSLVLSATKLDGSQATKTNYVVLGAKCQVLAFGKTLASMKLTLSGFLFNYVKFNLTPSFKKTLGSMVASLKVAKTITIYGYTETDTKSAAIKKSNLVLAANRAKSVVEFLKSKGVKATFKIVAKGGVDPVSTVDQAKNRRVVIQVTY